jgi:hypothetical protein
MTSGTRTFSAVKMAKLSLNGDGKFLRSHSVSLANFESLGIHNLSGRFSCVKFIKPKAKMAVKRNDPEMNLKGCVATRIPNL